MLKGKQIQTIVKIYLKKQQVFSNYLSVLVRSEEERSLRDNKDNVLRGDQQKFIRKQNSLVSWLTEHLLKYGMQLLRFHSSF